MPGSILDRYVSIPYNPGTNPYRYAKSWIIAEPAPDLEDDIVPKSIGQPEPLANERKVTRILKPPRNQGGALSRLGYSYEDSLSKLLDQKTILPRFTLGEMISLTNLAPTTRRTSSLV